MSAQLIKQGKDLTLERNTIKNKLFLIGEYELIKAKKHNRFKFVQEFYDHHGVSRQNFVKYYARYKRDLSSSSLLPQKRGPRFHLRVVPGFIEIKIVSLRSNGLSKYEIFNLLKPKLKKFTPSPSTIYNVFKKNDINKLQPKMKQNRRKIIKDNPGDLGHIDCHYLPKNIIADNNKRYFFVAVIDDCSRIVWAEVIEDTKSLTVMFAALKIINLINSEYQIQFREMMSDNGTEFGAGKKSSNEDTNPFKRMLKELGIKQRFTKPYRPQTNGKIERFWKTIDDELLGDVVFDSLEHLKDELMQYLLYYNHQRPHQGINGNIPAKFNDEMRGRE